MTRWLTVGVLTAVAVSAVLLSGAGAVMVVELVVLPLLVGAVVGVVLAVADRTGDDDAATRASDGRTVSRDLASMAGRVRSAARSRHGLLTDLLPELAYVADDLRRHHRVRAGSDRDRELLGGDLVDLLSSVRDPRHDRDRDGLPVADLHDLLDRLEHQ